MHRFEYDLFVIGGGSGGVRAGRVAAQRGLRVAIAEERDYGGTCVNRGCVPKKLYVYASHYGYDIEDAAQFGWNCPPATFHWPTLRDNVNREVARLSGLYEGGLERAGALHMHGRATLVDPHTVEVGDKRFTAAHILIATGGRPRPLDVPGGDLAITSDDIFTLPELPAHITIVGGGYIGMEFAHIMAGLRVPVTLVHHRDQVLRGFDDDIRAAATKGLSDHGIDAALADEIAQLERGDDGRIAVTLRSGRSFTTGLVMSTIGRIPNTAGMGLEGCGVAIAEGGAIEVDEYSQTSIPHIHAVGDCTDRMNLTPVAIREGQAFIDTVFDDRPTRVDYDNIPTAVFCQPPAATVGLTETEACRRHPSVDIYKVDFRPMRHAITGREQRTMMKLVVETESQKVIGVHIVGKGASELIQCVAIAVRAGLRKADFDATVALHPTAAEELVLMSRKVTRRQQADA